MNIYDATGLFCVQWYNNAYHQIKLSVSLDPNMGIKSKW